MSSKDAANGAPLVGLGGSGHEWATCLAHRGELIAIAEERVTRMKYGLGADLLAAESRKACLAAAGASLDDVEHAIACDLVPRSFRFPLRDRVEIINHHLAHAFCAFGLSGYEDAAILVADNSGSVLSGSKTGTEREVETISIFDADRTGIRLVDRVTGVQHLEAATESDFYDAGATSNSLGHLYRSATLALGFSFKHPSGDGVFSEDGKTMGLSPYGDDRFRDSAGELIELTESGLKCDPAKADSYLGSVLRKFTFDERAALANAVQYHLERAMLHLSKLAFKKTGRRRLCLAGGVALNSVANGRLVADSDFDAIYVPSAPSDDGIAFGCVAYGLWKHHGRWPSRSRTAYLGVPHEMTEIERAVNSMALNVERPDDIVAAAAERLCAGEIIAWYQGRSEYGPRALGHRSILALPRPGFVRDKLNHEMKRREWFRPYAPMVPLEDSDTYFEFPNDSPHMSFVAPVRRPSDLPAATHVDGTARLQTVAKDDNPEVYALLKLLGELTGAPVLLNTSFNRAGEPIVETPFEAIESAMAMRLDGLVLGPFLIRL